jgi:hypothetical protein
MNWTSEVPKAPGFYWIRWPVWKELRYEVVKVVQREEGLALDGHDDWVPLENVPKDRQWCGPYEPPA